MQHLQRDGQFEDALHGESLAAAYGDAFAGLDEQRRGADTPAVGRGNGGDLLLKR